MTFPTYQIRIVKFVKELVLQLVCYFRKITAIDYTIIRLITYITDIDY